MTHAATLNAAQIDRIRAVASERAVVSGEVLYNPGDDTPPVYVVLSGAIEVLALGNGCARTVAAYGVGEFSGELLMISGRRSIYQCRVKESGALLELRAHELRALIGRDAELNDILMTAFLARRASLREGGHGNVVVIGSKASADTLALRQFLARDGTPFAYYDVDTDAAAGAILREFGASAAEIPIVICDHSRVLRNPSPAAVVEALGFNSNISAVRIRDVVVVGAGPAGLAAAVYAASEGLDVLVVEKGAPGGQAGSSSKIENYLGFPAGLSGHELAGRALAQAEKFGAQIMVATTVVDLNCDERPYRITLESGQQIRARTIVLATGAQYNKPSLANVDEFTGRGVYYNATFMEAQLCAGEDVIVIGGGNSAGQAAIFLAQSAASVRMLVRGASLTDTMSTYLIQRIEENPTIRLHYGCEISRLSGNGHLERVCWQIKGAGDTVEEPIRHVFAMTGASPKTDWLATCLARDDKGFVLTGHDAETAPAPIPWGLSRPPSMLETSLPGVFVVGDARSGNVKRVASAVGEGAVVVHLVHQALA
jgi:thioredoxin reductase (NADPH)